MKLYLVRHAKAVSKQTDPQRSLTKEGRRDVEKVAAFIKPLNLCVDYLYNSGKKRAVQTADVLAEVIEVKKASASRDGLAPNDDVTAIRNGLVSVDEDIMLVGHLPFLDKLTSLLLTGSESAGIVASRQGGIVCLGRCEDDKWQIEWMITPELLVENKI